jgi:hypothetical protein
VPEEGGGMASRTLRGEWVLGPGGTAAGCSNHGRYMENPKYVFFVDLSNPHVRGGKIFLAARLVLGHPVAPGSSELSCGHGTTDHIACNLSLFKLEVPSSEVVTSETFRSPRLQRLAPKKALVSSGGGVYSNKPTGAFLSKGSGKGAVSIDESGYYCLVPSTFDPHPVPFHLLLHASSSALLTSFASI